MNRLAVPSIFLITLLPLGFGHTLFGTTAASLSLLAVGLSLSIFSMLVVLSTVPLGEWPKRAVEFIFTVPLPWFLLAVCGFSFSVALAVSSYRMACTPDIQDAAAQLIHARMLISGEVVRAAYPLSGFFNLGVMVNDTHYYSQYPPGHILMLAAGLLAGVPCAVGPLLGALTCIPAYGLANHLYGKRAGRLSAILTAASPMLLTMSSETMNHATSLLFISLFLWGMAVSLRRGHPAFAVLAGFAIAIALITRPLTALAMVLPIAVYATFHLRELGVARVLLMKLSALVPLAVLPWFNHATTGDWFTLGYQKLVSNRYGFGEVPEPMLPWVSQHVHTLWHGIGMAFNNLNALHLYLFLWPGSSLVFVALAFWKRKASGFEFALLASCAMLVVAYIPYYFQGWGTGGPRFMYEASIILIMFTSFGILRTLELFPAMRHQRTGFVVVACVVFGLGFFVHQQMGLPRHIPPLAAIEARTQGKPTILFMPFAAEYWQLAGVTYPVKEGDQLIFANDLGEKNKELMKLYPGYAAYRASHIGTPRETWEEIKP